VVPVLPALPPVNPQAQNTGSPTNIQPTLNNTPIPTITQASIDSPKQLKSTLSSLPQSVQQIQNPKIIEPKKKN
jgi:hypothetical protein